MNDPRLEESVEPMFLGSDCCKEEIEHINDIPTCSFCNEPCEELYETREEAQQRHDDEFFMRRTRPRRRALSRR